MFILKYTCRWGRNLLPLAKKWGPKFYKSHGEDVINFLVSNDYAESLFKIYNGYDNLVINNTIISSGDTIFNFAINNRKNKIKAKILENYIQQIITEPEICENDEVIEFALDRIKCEKDVALCVKAIMNKSIQMHNEPWIILINHINEFEEALQNNAIQKIALDKAFENNNPYAILAIININEAVCLDKFREDKSFRVYCASINYDIFIHFENLLETYAETEMLEAAVKARQEKNIDLLIKHKVNMTNELIALIFNEYPEYKRYVPFLKTWRRIMATTNYLLTKNMV